MLGSGNTVPVIILTAYGEVDTYLEAMNAGATEYLNKPIQSDELLKSVRACLRSGKNRRNRLGLGAGRTSHFRLSHLFRRSTRTVSRPSLLPSPQFQSPDPSP